MGSICAAKLFFSINFVAITEARTKKVLQRKRFVLVGGLDEMN